MRHHPTEGKKYPASAPQEQCVSPCCRNTSCPGAPSSCGQCRQCAAATSAHGQHAGMGIAAATSTHGAYRQYAAATSMQCCRNTCCAAATSMHTGNARQSRALCLALLPQHLLPWSTQLIRTYRQCAAAYRQCAAAIAAAYRQCAAATSTHGGYRLRMGGWPHCSIVPMDASGSRLVREMQNFIHFRLHAARDVARAFWPGFSRAWEAASRRAAACSSDAAGGR